MEARLVLGPDVSVPSNEPPPAQAVFPRIFLEITSEPDTFGRQQFISRCDDGTGQVFFMCVEEYIGWHKPGIVAVAS